MSRRNGKPRHADRLLSSSMDDVALGVAVDEKFLVLCKRYLDVTGNQLLIPQSMDRDVMRWREMRVRHKRGDFRHTEAEIKSLRAVAQWTVDVNDVICGQPKRAPIQWERE